MGGGVSKERSLDFVSSEYFAINLHSRTLRAPTNKRPTSDFLMHVHVALDSYIDNQGSEFRFMYFPPQILLPL